VQLTVDEYETIRLVDLEKRTHEGSALLMGISRTTVTEIYERARFKLADCIVNGKQLLIAGGNYQLCNGSIRQCCGRKCDQARQIRQYEKGETHMKIAVTYENGQIFQHFGHTECFKIYEVDNSRILREEVINTEGSGHGALAGFLSERNVSHVICGGIGGGAQAALAQAGIQLYGGVTGDADEAVKAFLAGELVYNADVHCDHHDHEHHGQGCGEERHGCAGHGGQCGV